MITNELQTALQAIKLVIFDVDGVLTDGKITYTQSGSETKAFFAQDGLGIKLLHQVKIKTALITKRQSDMVVRRANELNVNYLYQGQHDKRKTFADLQKQTNLAKEQIAYMGDDLPDLALIKQVGVGATVANGATTVQTHANWISQYHGGCGAVREFCELILTAQGKFDNAIKAYF